MIQALRSKAKNTTASGYGGRVVDSFDSVFVLTAAFLLFFGLIMVTSASMEVVSEKFGDPLFHFYRQGAFLVAGIIGFLITLKIPTRFWQEFGWVLLVLAFLLLVAVLVPGIGREVNGSNRWIGFGSINLQASEIAKIFVLIYLAGYLVRRQTEVRSQWSGFLKPMIVLALMIVLLLAEPDFGAVVVLMGASLGMIFLAGVRLQQFIILLSGCLSAMAIMAVSQSYRMQRLVTFTDPWADQFGSGYQLTQSLIAFGRGDLFGMGLGNSVQKLFYLPEAHTDFVFAVIAEEFGVVGAVFTVCLYLLLTLRALEIGRFANMAGLQFQAYLAYGLGLLLGGQALINIGVNIGLLPTKGLTLPLLSYGGSSLLAVCFVVGLLLRIDYETREKKLA